jgi:hypothetical protein
MARTNSLYEHVLAITADYLGPAAHRFVDRQIENHLKKSPQDFTKNDLGTFIDWTNIALAVLTEDKKLRREYTARLQALLHKNHQKSSSNE